MRCAAGAQYESRVAPCPLAVTRCTARCRRELFPLLLAVRCCVRSLLLLLLLLLRHTAAAARIVACRRVRTRGRTPLRVQRRQLALKLVLLELHAVLKLKPALEVVEPRRRRYVQQLLFNGARLSTVNERYNHTSAATCELPSQDAATIQYKRRKGRTTCKRSSYVEHRLVYASRILDRTACRSSIVKYIRQSCMLVADCEMLRVVAGASALGPPLPLALMDDDGAWPRNALCDDTGRFSTPDDVTARSICGGFVLGVACSTDGIEFMPTPRCEPSVPLLLLLWPMTGWPLWPLCTTWLLCPPCTLCPPCPLCPDTPPPAPPLSVRLSDGIDAAACAPPFALSFIAPMFMLAGSVRARAARLVLLCSRRCSLARECAAAAAARTSRAAPA